MDTYLIELLASVGARSPSQHANRRLPFFTSFSMHDMKRKKCIYFVPECFRCASTPSARLLARGSQPFRRNCDIDRQTSEDYVIWNGDCEQLCILQLECQPELSWQNELALMRPHGELKNDGDGGRKVGSPMQELTEKFAYHSFMFTFVCVVHLHWLISNHE